MERFNSIYLFTTENIAGYMNELDLRNKKIITVTGSSDHIINAILKGCTDITTFDINLLCKYFMDLKLSVIKELEYDDFMNFFLYDSDITLNIDIIKKLEMDDESKSFWLDKLSKNDNDGLKLKYSGLFNLKYFDISNKIECNLYLNEKDYNTIKNNLMNVNIRFINSNLKDLNLDEEYDYMFLSNISDYITDMYEIDCLNNYKDLIFKFLEKTKIIYFAYIYDINSQIKRSIIDDIDKIKELFGVFRVINVKSALINQSNNTKDAVYIKGGF